MTIKNILVYVDGSPGSGTALKGAVRIASDFDAKLTGFYVIPDFAIVAAVPEAAMMSEQLLADMRENAEKKAVAAETLFREASKTLGEKSDWVCEDGALSGTRDAAAALAFYSDLTVIGQYDDETPTENDASLPQDLVVDSGRPLILLPKTADMAGFGNHVMIAWKESREAARAVSDALPFLSGAKTVTVMTVAKQDKTEGADLGKIKQFLGEHGIKATVDSVTAKDGESTSAAMFAHAHRSGADMLVAGAYSHSRWREGLFGGVTKSIFNSISIPTLLSH
jgi:nucleotide-binding universal stress UspA family protein